MASSNGLQIAEIFYSIQGESTFAGFPCFFIRLSGCNLRCSYCDSRYAVEEQGRYLSMDDIFSRIAAHKGALVEITGGEPLLQPVVFDLIDHLLEDGRTVLIETNGSLDIAGISIEATVIMDIKCPGSGAASFHTDNIDIVRRRALMRSGSTEIKFVLSGPEDYAWAKEMIAEYDLTAFAPVLFSPVNGRFPAERLATSLLEDGLPVRLQVQLQRILWPGIHRGV